MDNNIYFYKNMCGEVSNIKRNIKCICLILSQWMLLLFRKTL